MTRGLKIAVAVAAMVMLTACVAGSGESAHAAHGGMLSQLFLGLWHGIIAPFVLIVEVVDRFFPHMLPWTAHLYETTAAGAPYDVGFYIGLGGGPLAIRSRF